MKIICTKCSNIMSGGQVMPYLIDYLAKKIAPTLGKIMIMALEYYWSSPKKSVFDDTLASCANISELKCSDCKKRGNWKPAPELDIIQKPIQKEEPLLKF